MDNTLMDEIILSNDYFINAVTAAKIMGVSPQSLRECAQKRPDLIGFPYSYIGTKMIIPRESFIDWVIRRKA